MLVLHLDDDLVDREGLRRLVERRDLGWDVLSASSLGEGVLVLQQQGRHVEVAIVDVELAGERGLDILPHRGATPVIIVTGQGSEQVAQEALNRGAAWYVIKRPGYLEELPIIVEMVLDRIRLTAERDAALAGLARAVGRELPVCRNCARSPDKAGDWLPLPDLLTSSAQVDLKIETCPDCRAKLVRRRSGAQPPPKPTGPTLTLQAAYRMNYPQDDPVVRLLNDGHPQEDLDREGDHLSITRLVKRLNLFLVAGPGWSGLYVESGAGLGLRAATEVQIEEFLRLASDASDAGVSAMVKACPCDGPPVTAVGLYPPAEWPAGIVFHGVS